MENLLVARIAEGDGVDVGAILDDDVQVDMHAVLGGIDDHAAAQTRRRQDLGNAVGGVRGGHAHDAIAFERGMTDHVGQHVVGHMKLSRNRSAHEFSFRKWFQGGCP